jgi:hypothetical protein
LPEIDEPRPAAGADYVQPLSTSIEFRVASFIQHFPFKELLRNNSTRKSRRLEKLYARCPHRRPMVYAD